MTQKEHTSEEKMMTEESSRLSEVTELLQRTQANFENYRKQTEKRIEEIREMAAKDVILEILPIVDNFELALKNICGEDENSEFIKGIQLIYSQFIGVLADNQVQPFETAGEIFDPYMHEALMKVNSDQPENIIIEEFQKGFTLHGKVIRHAKVKISAGKKQEEKSNDENNDKNNSQGGK